MSALSRTSKSDFFFGDRFLYYNGVDDWVGQFFLEWVDGIGFMVMLVGTWLIFFETFSKIVWFLPFFSGDIEVSGSDGDWWNTANRYALGFGRWMSKWMNVFFHSPMKAMSYFKMEVYIIFMILLSFSIILYSYYRIMYLLSLLKYIFAFFVFNISRGIQRFFYFRQKYHLANLLYYEYLL